MGIQSTEFENEGRCAIPREDRPSLRIDAAELLSLVSGWAVGTSILRYSLLQSNFWVPVE